MIHVHANTPKGPPEFMPTLCDSTYRAFSRLIGREITANEIEVHNGDGPPAPMVITEPKTPGTTRILLWAKDDKWDRTVYQFAHELCHVATNCEGAYNSKEFKWVDVSGQVKPAS